MKSKQIKKLPARFYKNENGREPVREWLKKQKIETKKLVGADIMKVEFGWPIGMPTCRPMGEGLFEVRTDLENTIARVLFCIHQNEIILLHGIIKKSQNTPKGALETAKARKKEVEKG